MKQAQLKATNGVHAEKEQHKVPKRLYDNLAALKERAENDIQKIRSDFNRAASLLVEGYAASLDPGKNYNLSEDLKTLTET